MSGQRLLIEREGPVTWLTLNRPGALNTLDADMLDALDGALSEIERDEGVRCVVLTGAGRAFCAGADLKFVEAMPAKARTDATMVFLRRATAVMTRLERLPKPVIAAVNGVATAGGMELVLCCDLVVAAGTARFGDGHANYGLLPGAGATMRLPRKIGATRAAFLFFTGDLVSADAMVSAGLVNEVVAPDRLRAAAAALASRIAIKSPAMLRTVKALARDAHDRTVDEGLAAELDANIAHAETEDRAEGLAAFRDGRTPLFTGR